MKVANPNVVIPDQPVIRSAMKTAESIWKARGRVEGLTLTCGKNGVHGPGSWHYCGAAADLRMHYGNHKFWEAGNYHDYPPESEVWTESEQIAAYEELKSKLPEFDIIWHDSHIHMEPGDSLARKWGLLV